MSPWARVVGKVSDTIVFLEGGRAGIMRQAGEQQGESLAGSRQSFRARARGWSLTSGCTAATLSMFLYAVQAIAQSPLAPPTAEELEYGRYLAQECAGCHRLGSSYSGGNYSGVPGIAGYPAEEFLEKLKDKGNAANAILRDTVGTLDPEQLRLIALYLSTLPPE